MVMVYELHGQYDGFCVEVHNSKSETELYLYHKRYGIRELMIGVNLVSNEWEIELFINGYIEECVERYIDGFINEEIA